MEPTAVPDLSQLFPSRNSEATPVLQTEEPASPSAVYQGEDPYDSLKLYTQFEAGTLFDPDYATPQGTFGVGGEVRFPYGLGVSMRFGNELDNYFLNILPQVDVTDKTFHYRALPTSLTWHTPEVGGRNLIHHPHNDDAFQGLSLFGGIGFYCDSRADSGPATSRLDSFWETGLDACSTGERGNSTCLGLTSINYQQSGQDDHGVLVNLKVGLLGKAFRF